MHVASRRSFFQSKIFMMKSEKNKELLFLKKKIELLPSILVIRNPNRSQSLNKRIDCV